MEMIDNYNKLTLGKYVEIRKIAQDGNLEELERQTRILSILSDIPEEEILHLPIHTYKEMVIASRFLEREDMNKHLIAKSYNYGGMELIPVKDYRKIETCQYVDFQTFASDLDNKMVELLSVMLVPKGHRYNEGYDVLDVQDVIRKEMSVTDAISLTAFFLAMLRQSIVDSLNYSMKMLKGIKDKTKRAELMERVRQLQTLLG